MSEKSTKIAIMGVMRCLMQEKPLSMITVEDVILRAGIARSTFYRLFRDKYDLMNCCYSDDVDRIIASHDLRDYISTSEEIFSYIVTHQEFLQRAVRTSGQNSFLDFFQSYLEKYLSSVITELSGKASLNRLQRVMIEHHCAGWVYTASRLFRPGAGETALGYGKNYIRDIMPLIVGEILSIEPPAAI